MRTVIGRCELVTRSASAHLEGGADMGRMRIVATHAAPRSCRMVGMNILVTRWAGPCGGASHVVRRVAIGATAVRRDAPAADHVHLRVTAATRRGFFFLELVRLMAADTLRVSARKQRRGRNDRLLFGVTRGARADRRRGRSVPLHVAGRTSFDQ